MSGEPMSEKRLAEIEQDRESGYFAEWSDVAELIAEVRRLRDVSEGALASLGRYQAELRRELAYREALELDDAGLLEAAERLRRERRTGASPDRMRDEE
jgi:hypothetical protein